MIYGQILNNVLQNTIILNDASCVDHFTVGYDYCIQIDNLSPIPKIGSFYDGENFADVISLAIPDGLEIPSGSETTFDPFIICPHNYSFTVSIDGDILTVGCQQYDYRWLRYAFWSVLTQGITRVGPISVNLDGTVGYGTLFNIPVVDINSMYTQLCTLLP